jgi:multidrug efflux system membrane fusion protein
VTTAVVSEKSMPLDVRAIGTVIAASTVSVRAQITGEMTSVHFKEGEDVEEGQVLVRLDRRPFEAALHQAEAALARDQAQAANARAQATRYQDLAQRGIATKEQVEQMLTNAAALEATLGADRAAVENAKIQLDYATITAPFTGRTGLLQVHPGNLVRANDTAPIVTINRITPVYVSFAVPERCSRISSATWDRARSPSRRSHPTTTGRHRRAASTSSTTPSIPPPAPSR